MIKRLLAVCAIIIITVAAQAQKDKSKQEAKYEEVSASLKKEIWAWKKPEFDVRNIPAEYNSYSTVVIARHQEIIGDSRSRSKFMIGMAFYREMSINTVTREAIKINDKSALSDYSEISFTKLENRAGMFRSNKAATYVGIRVIKPDGKMKEINADEIVQTNADKNKKEAKLAVSDLQVGDIIDYYIAQQVISDGTDYNESGLYRHSFLFYDDAPVMSYSVHIELGRKYAVEYRCYNGAPDFKVTRSDDEDIIMDAVKKNISANKETGLWASPLRQLPITRLNIVPGYKGMFANKINARKPGEVYKNQNAEEYVEDRTNKIAMNNMGTYFGFSIPGAKDYIKQLQKNKEDISIDSLAGACYYLHRFGTLLQLDGTEKIESVIARPFLDLNADIFLESFSKYLRAYDIANSLVLTTSKYGPQMKDVLGDDFSYLIKTEGTKKSIFGFTDIFTPAFYTPSYFEDGKQAVTIDVHNIGNVKVKNFTKGSTNIPGTTAKANARIENLKVALTTDAATLQIDRNTTLRGHYKSDVQQALISFEEYYEAERKLFGIEKSLVEDLADGKRTRKFADELSAALKLEREKQKDRFTNEAKEWFEQEVTDLSNPKLHNLGTRHYKPDFVYSASFKMGGLVKKAGNNFIIDIGKLQGSPLTLTEAQRKRTIDVYMPFARSVETTITFTIPEGFSAEGVAALNKKVENETGYFITEAAVTGNQLVIAIKKSYNHAFEPAANWDKLLAFIDAANEFTNAKILLKKK